MFLFIIELIIEFFFLGFYGKQRLLRVLVHGTLRNLSTVGSHDVCTTPSLAGKKAIFLMNVAMS